MALSLFHLIQSRVVSPMVSGKLFRMILDSYVLYKRKSRGATPSGGVQPIRALVADIL
jgi:hypothetical protein